MIRTTSSLLLALAVALGSLALAPPAEAQTKRAGDTFYLKFGGGFSDYTGDFDSSPFAFDEFSEGTGFPYGWTGEVGYQTSPQFALALAYQAGRYPLVLNDAPGTDPDRFTAQLLGRYTFGAQDWTVAPYLDAGVNASFTGTDSGAGPTAGIGLDFVLNDFASFYIETRSNLTFGDAAMDGVESGTSFDALSHLGAGFKLNFKRATTPPRILALDGPTEVETGQSATYTATINEGEATRPLEYQWNFGDGSTGSGLTASHTFEEPGTYTVTFTVSNRAGQASESLTVNAVLPPQPAQITSISANPNPADEGSQVRFQSNVQGDSPISYEWSFGDGNTATGSLPTHTYEEPGEYTVELEASNDVGSDSRTLTMQVNRALPEICMTISELNSVYFESNSSTLTDEAESSLQENVEILVQCPNLDVRVEGFAAPGERNVQSLSEDRAQAVADFYEENDVEGSRISTIGRGQVEGVTTKKGGTRQYRRVDSIPVREDSDM